MPFGQRLEGKPCGQKPLPLVYVVQKDVNLIDPTFHCGLGLLISKGSLHKYYILLPILYAIPVPHRRYLVVAFALLFQLRHVFLIEYAYSFPYRSVCTQLGLARVSARHMTHHVR